MKKNCIIRILPSANTMSRHSQSGVTLIEALISLVILALGVLALLGVQLRTLKETQTGVGRAQAVRLVEDLAERVKVNPGTFIEHGNYAVAWGAPPAAAADCGVNACTAVQLASWDINRWKTSVANNMPAGDATVFVLPADNTQLGVVVAWRANEANNAADYLAVQNLGQGIPAACPPNLICHLVFIQR